MSGTVIAGLVIGLILGAGITFAIIYFTKNFNPPPSEAPLTAPEEAKASEILQNKDIIQAEIQKIPDLQKRKELIQTIKTLEAEQTQSKIRGRNGTGIGPSAIPRKEHENLEELWKYLQGNDVWMQRRGSNNETFWL